MLERGYQKNIKKTAALFAGQTALFSGQTALFADRVFLVHFERHGYGYAAF